MIKFVKVILVLELIGVLAGCAFVEKKETELSIQKTVTSQNDKLSYCYKKALEENNNLEGEMSLSWDISYLTGQEQISNVAVEKSDIISETLANCMKQAIATMRFQLPTRDTQKIHRVSYPFVFKNDKDLKLKR